MKIFLTACLFCLVGGAAMAQEHPTRVESETIAFLEAKAANSKVKLELVDSVIVGTLRDGGFDHAFVTINPKKSYAVLGACEDACTNFDIVAFDSKDQVIDSDLQPDASPVALIDAGPKPGAAVKLFLSMKHCTQPTCVYAAGLYEVKDH